MSSSGKGSQNVSTKSATETDGKSGKDKGKEDVAPSLETRKKN